MQDHPFNLFASDPASKYSCASFDPETWETVGNCVSKKGGQLHRWAASQVAFASHSVIRCTSCAGKTSEPVQHEQGTANFAEVRLPTSCCTGCLLAWAGKEGKSWQAAAEAPGRPHWNARAPGCSAELVNFGLGLKEIIPEDLRSLQEKTQ